MTNTEYRLYKAKQAALKEYNAANDALLKYRADRKQKHEALSKEYGGWYGKAWGWNTKWSLDRAIYFESIGVLEEFEAFCALKRKIEAEG